MSDAPRMIILKEIFWKSEFKFQSVKCQTDGDVVFWSRRLKKKKEV